MLLTTATQNTAIKDQITQLDKLLSDKNSDKQSLEELLQYRQSYEYIAHWAEQNGYLPESVELWLQENAK